jgi:APA family basic amino acid/polyamine antiporter
MGSAIAGSASSRTARWEHLLKVANASAFTQPVADRRWPRWLNVTGLVGCALLAVTLPTASAVAGAAVFAAGLAGRALVRRVETRAG